MTIKTQLARWLLGPELREVRRVNAALLDAYNYAMTPSGLVERLGEVDSQLIDLLLDLRRYEQIGQRAGTVNETDRLRSVELSRYMEQHDVLTGLAVDMWTDFGFGQSVRIAPNDPLGAQVWEECWTAPRNRPIFAQDSIHELFSRKLLIDGERFFVAYAALDGDVTWRIFDTDQVKDVVTAVGDKAIKLWYIVEMNDGERYAFPDAFALFAFGERYKQAELPAGVLDVNRTEQNLETQTFAAIVPAQRNLDDNGRGWPQFRKAFPWSEVTRENLENHAAVSRLVATYVDKITAKGGQRALDYIRDSLQSSLVNNDEYYDTNPPGAAGSTWLQNEQLDRTRMPLSTGARDAQTDSMILLSMFAAGSKIPPHYLMRPDMLQNRAVADALIPPAVESWRRYQAFWAARFSNLVETTLRLKARFDRRYNFTDYSAVIALDSPLDLDAQELSRAMSSVTEAAVGGALDFSVANRTNTALVQLLLADFGINDPEGVVAQPEVVTAEALVEQDLDGAELPEREELDEKMEAAVSGILANFRSEAEQALEAGEEPDYNQLEALLVAALIPVLMQAARERADEIQGRFEFYIDSAVLDEEIAKNAEEHARRLAPELVQTTRNLIEQIDSETSPDAQNDLLDRATGEERSRRIGITEVTFALSAGLLLLNMLYRRQYNVEMVTRWYTQEDERVCEICGPLHGTTRRTWGRQFPNGPPAHPRCRCFEHVTRLRQLP